jgi:hypothetical protein
MKVCNGRPGCNGALVRCTHTHKAETLREALRASVAMEQWRVKEVSGRLLVHPHYSGA